MNRQKSFVRQKSIHLRRTQTILLWLEFDRSSVEVLMLHAKAIQCSLFLSRHLCDLHLRKKCEKWKSLMKLQRFDAIGWCACVSSHRWIRSEEKRRKATENGNFWFVLIYQIGIAMIKLHVWEYSGLQLARAYRHMSKSNNIDHVIFISIYQNSMISHERWREKEIAREDKWNRTQTPRKKQWVDCFSGAVCDLQMTNAVKLEWSGTCE